MAMKQLGNAPSLASDTATKSYVDSLVLLSPQNMTLVPVKTASYSANIQEIVPCDASGSNLVVTLPQAPADNSRIVVKKIDGSANTITVTCQGSDKIDSATGPSTYPIEVEGETVTVHYRAGVWYVIEHSLPDAATKNYVDAAKNSFAANVGDGSATSIAVTHNLGTLDVVVSVHLISTGEEVECDVVKTSGNVVTLTFATAPALNSLRCIVIGTAFGTGSPTPVASTGITDATSTGRSLITAADAKAAKAAISADFFVNVKDYGAKGDNSTDDTSALQSAIDAAYTKLPTSLLAVASALSHVTVFLPSGDYKTANLTVPTGVTLVGEGATLRPITGTTGYLVTFQSGQWGGMKDLNFRGNDTDDLAAVFIAPGRRLVSITHCSISYFRRQALVISGGGSYVSDCFLEGFRGDNSDLTDYAGVVDLKDGGHDTWLTNLELNGTRYSALGRTSANYFACALSIKGSGNVMGQHLICENADIGVHVRDVLLLNLHGVRAELNYSHGFFMESGSGRLSDCQAWDNSKYGDNLADGFHMGTNTTNFSCTNLVSWCTGDIKHRYGIYDVGTYASSRNTYINPRSYSNNAAFADVSGGRQGGPLYGFPAGAAISISGTTPDISGRLWLRAGDSSTITNFVGTVPGQLFRILGNGTASVANNSTIATLSGATTTLESGVWYTFLKHDGVHREVDLSGKTLSGKTLSSPTLTNPKINGIKDSNGNTSILLSPSANAVNYVTLTNAASNGAVYVQAGSSGPDTNVALGLGPLGSERVWLYQPSGSTFRLQANGPGSDIGVNLISKGAGTIQANGVPVVRRNTQTVTSSTTLGTNGDYIVFVGSGGAPILPTAVGNTGRYTFKNIHDADRTISTTSSQTIDGSTTLTLPPGDAVELVSDGSNWRVL